MEQVHCRTGSEFVVGPIDASLWREDPNRGRDLEGYCLDSVSKPCASAMIARGTPECCDTP